MIGQGEWRADVFPFDLRALGRADPLRGARPRQAGTLARGPYRQDPGQKGKGQDR